MSEQTYIRSIRSLYLQLPNTHRRFSRSDRSLAADLFRQGIPITVVSNALLLATARRICRDPTAPALPPVRSLYYFIPAIHEVLSQPLPTSYQEYLKRKIADHT